jgi:hypothetical protein
MLKLAIPRHRACPGSSGGGESKDLAVDASVEGISAGSRDIRASVCQAMTLGCRGTRFDARNEFGLRYRLAVQIGIGIVRLTL